ncbi:MAG: hypothetical protein KDJ65_36870 [Anaerolineae bacterium]|nr:hypothetical protein [Anaerolineae bacterium]
MTKPSAAENSPALVCDLTAIEAEQRDHHIIATKRLFNHVQATHELENGYAFRLPNDTDTIRHTAEFIIQERKCCSFFTFALELEASGGPLWLRITGQEGVKEVIRAEFGELF